MTTLNEEFEIVIRTHDDEVYDYEKGEYRPQYLEEIAITLAEIGISKEQIEHARTDAGVGASAEAIAIVIAGLFFSGKRIQENLEAWINLGTRLNGVLRKLSRRGSGEHRTLYVSEPVAAALAVGCIVERESGLKRIELESARIEQVPNRSIGPQFRGIFKYDQMRYYIFSFRVFGKRESVHLIGIRSTGEMEFHHILHISEWEKFYGFDSD